MKHKSYDMKTAIRIIISLVLAISAIPARAWDTGWEAGVVGARTISGSQSVTEDRNLWSYGAGAAFRWQVPVKLPVKLYLRPELNLQAGNIYRMWDGGRPTREYFYGTEFNLGLGIQLYKNLSFYTGPQFRYTTTDKDNTIATEMRNRLTSYWSFGLYVHVRHIYAMLKYCQGLTERSYNFYVDHYLHKSRYCNKFELSLGYRF